MARRRQLGSPRLLGREPDRRGRRRHDLACAAGRPADARRVGAPRGAGGGRGTQRRLGARRHALHAVRRPGGLRRNRNCRERGRPDLVLEHPAGRRTAIRRRAVGAAHLQRPVGAVRADPGRAADAGRGGAGERRRALRRARERGAPTLHRERDHGVHADHRRVAVLLGLPRPDQSAARGDAAVAKRGERLGASRVLGVRPDRLGHAGHGLAAALGPACRSLDNGCGWR